MKAIIIGAGTGGLALAHGLKQAGIDVSVCERDRTPRDDRGGFRVGISPGGSRALKACVPPDIYDLFVATSARPPHYFNLLTEQFSELVSLELEGEAAVLMSTAAGDAPPSNSQIEHLRELRLLYEPFLAALADYFCFRYPRFVPDQARPDNWQTTAWGKTAGLIEPHTAVAIDDRAIRHV